MYPQSARLEQDLGKCYDSDVAANEAGYRPDTLEPLIRGAALTGIALLVVRRFVYLLFPNFLPSSAWRPESWGAGLAISVAFELILLVALLGLPICIYFFRLRTGNTSARDLLIDCAFTVGLYLTALLLL